MKVMMLDRLITFTQGSREEATFGVLSQAALTSAGLVCSPCWPPLMIQLPRAVWALERAALSSLPEPCSPSSRALVGSSSTVLTGSGARHSGQSSCGRAGSCLCRQGWQEESWRGRTSAAESSRSWHTGQSSKAMTTCPSIDISLCEWTERLLSTRLEQNRVRTESEPHRASTGNTNRVVVSL